jgi:hypothetical protein
LVPNRTVIVGYFTQWRVNAHGYWLNIKIVMAEAVPQHLPRLNEGDVASETIFAPVRRLSLYFGKAP